MSGDGWLAGAKYLISRQLSVPGPGLSSQASNDRVLSPVRLVLALESVESVLTHRDHNYCLSSSWG